LLNFPLGGAKNSSSERGFHVKPRLIALSICSKILSCPTRAHQLLPEEEETAEMMAFHANGQVLESPPAKKQKIRAAASPMPITTEQKAITK